MFQKGQREGFEPGQLQECIAHFEGALRLEPRLITARVVPALALLQEHRNDEAKEQLDIVLDRLPNHPSALAGMGALMVGEKRWPDARDLFERALTYDPNLADAQHGLGLVLINEGRNLEAISHLKIASQLRPESFEVHYVLANALFNLHDFRTAVDQYQEGLAHPARLS